MSETTNETTNEATVTTGGQIYAAGSWGDMLAKSSTLKARAGKADKQAGVLLWNGAKGAISEWTESKIDTTGETLYNDVIAALGRSRKGDASKIKLVALAFTQHGLDLTAHDGLSKAYAEARRLLQINVRNDSDDEIAEELTAAIDAPKTASSLSSAAAMLLANGIDAAVVALLDKIKDAADDDQAKTESAYRSFLRAGTAEVAARVKFVADQASKAKHEANEATRAEREEQAAARKAAQAAKVKATPVKAAAKSAPVKATPAAKKPVPAKATASPKPAAAPVKRPAPVVRPKPVAK
jgi:hypothetical protein